MPGISFKGETFPKNYFVAVNHERVTFKVTYDSYFEV